MIISFTTAVTVSAQGWSGHLFNDPRPPSKAESIPCPEGAARAPGARRTKCKCAFGYAGGLDWDDVQDNYVGECRPTDCPSHANPGEYAGTCQCESPFKGILQWVSHPRPHYSGDCLEVPCPQFSHSIAAIEEVEFVFGGHEVTMEANSSSEIFHTAAEMLMLNSQGQKTKVTPVREPRCACDDGYVGGYIWDYGSRQWAGGCMQEHPCPVGQRGAHPASWVTPPWKLKHSAQDSSRISPKQDGACHPASCPSHAKYDISSGLCMCFGDYGGTLQWNITAESYQGRCTPSWSCPQNSVHRLLPISTVRYRLGCVCKDGYYGGRTTWGPGGHSRRWHGTCHRVPCPRGSMRQTRGPCACPGGQQGVAWSRFYHQYRGVCTDKTTTTTTVSTTSSTTSAPARTASTRVPEGASGQQHHASGQQHRASGQQHQTSTVKPSDRHSTSIRPTKTPDVVTEEESLVGHGMYVMAAFVLVAGIVVHCQGDKADAPNDNEKNYGDAHGDELRPLRDDSSDAGSTDRSSPSRKGSAAFGSGGKVASSSGLESKQAVQRANSRVSFAASEESSVSASGSLTSNVV